MPLGRKRSVLISLCKCIFGRDPPEGVKTIVPYELIREFKTIFTGIPASNAFLGKPGYCITETVLNLNRKESPPREASYLNVQ
jgi:hypothetical protein